MDIARLGGPPSPGIRLLLVTSSNAADRIGRAGLAWISSDGSRSDRGRTCWREIDRINRERQAERGGRWRGRTEGWRRRPGRARRGRVTGAGVASGVVGLVRGAAQGAFGRPAFAIALGAGGPSVPDRGARSGQSISAARCVRPCATGSIKAADTPWRRFTLKRDALGAFAPFWRTDLRPRLAAARRNDCLLIDGALTCRRRQSRNRRRDSKRRAFGAGNPEPVLARGHQLADVRKPAPRICGPACAPAMAQPSNVIAFRARRQSRGRVWAIAGGGAHGASDGSLAVDRWNGAESECSCA